MTLAAASALPMTHLTALDALREITAGREIRVFGFGECHDTPGIPDSVPTTLERFTALLPFLAQEQGVRMIGMEPLPQTCNPVLRRYMEKGDEDCIDALFPDRESGARRRYSAFLEESRRLAGMAGALKVWGVGPSEEEYFAAIIFGDPSKAIDILNGNVVRLAGRAVKRGLKAAFYNGADHTVFERHPSGAYEKVCYVPDLLRRLGLGLEHYLAVRLIVPEVLLLGGYGDRAPEYLELSQRAPSDGVHLMKDSEQGYTIVYSKCRLPESNRDGVAPIGF